MLAKSSFLCFTFGFIYVYVDLKMDTYNTFFLSSPAVPPGPPMIMTPECCCGFLRG